MTTLEPPTTLSRVIGAVGRASDGPLMLILGGMHGNEPSGIQAARRVFDRLEGEGIAVAGRVVALAGNLTALARQQRFVDQDLNRIFSADAIALATAGETIDTTVEERERREIVEFVDRELQLSHGPAVFLDLHSTSALGAPFSIMSDTIQNRRITFGLPVPVILGLEETIENTLMEYYGEMGHVALAVEGGQHDDPTTADHHESVIWIALVAGGLVAEADVPDLGAHRARLTRAAPELPHVVEITHRHGLHAGDGFRMKPGFLNFTSVKKGQHLAHDGRGDVRSPHSGLILMPNYQAQGDDGYFLGREINLFWLKLSALLRRYRLGRLLPLMPGVRRHPVRADQLLVDRRVARWLVRQIFHLFGYRRIRPAGKDLVFSRRPEGRRLREREQREREERERGSDRDHRDTP